MLVSSVKVDWRVRGRSGGFSVSSFKSFPDNFLAFRGTSPLQVEGRRKEGWRKGGRGSISKHLFNFLCTVFFLWKSSSHVSVNFQTYLFSKVHFSLQLVHAISFPQLWSRFCKQVYHSVGIYIVLLLCLENDEIRLENHSSGNPTLFLFAEA